MRRYFTPAGLWGAATGGVVGVLLVGLVMSMHRPSAADYTGASTGDSGLVTLAGATGSPQLIDYKKVVWSRLHLHDFEQSLKLVSGLKHGEVRDALLETLANSQLPGIEYDYGLDEPARMIHPIYQVPTDALPPRIARVNTIQKACVNPRRKLDLLLRLAYWQNRYNLAQRKAQPSAAAAAEVVPALQVADLLAEAARLAAQSPATTDAPETQTASLTPLWLGGAICSILGYCLSQMFSPLLQAQGIQISMALMEKYGDTALLKQEGKDRILDILRRLAPSWLELPTASPPPVVAPEIRPEAPESTASE